MTCFVMFQPWRTDSMIDDSVKVYDRAESFKYNITL